MALTRLLLCVSLGVVFGADMCGASALTSQYQLDFADPTVKDYAQLNIESPMTSVTVSFWIRTTDTEHQGTPFSYAVHGEPNAFTITDYNNLNLIVNGEDVSIALSLNDGAWHHVVLTWSSLIGNWTIYVDGELKDQGYNLSTAKPIPGKGIFIIGQEQDSFGGGFSSHESFFGTLTQLNVWDQELTLQDVDRMRFNCEAFNGNVIAWPNVQSAIKGNLGSSSSTFCSECPVPVKPANGDVTFTGVTAGSQADYMCDLGYTMEGNPQLKCLVTGNWDEQFPGCLAVVCHHPGRVRNGYVIGRDFSYNKTIRIQCNAGYELDGSSTMTCDQWGDWDVDKPKCDEIQCSLPTLSENTIANSASSKFSPGTIVIFSCKPGNLMQTQHSSVICQRDGSWDQSVPSCDPQKCGVPPQIQHGEPWTSNSEYNVGEIVRYQCDFGYEYSPGVPNAKRAIACQPSGEWESELPVCVPIKCPDPPIVTNGVATGQGRTYHSLVNYICLQGFEPVGKSVIKCEENKDWSSLTFKCVPLDCGKPPTFSHGSITGDIYKYDHLINYHCTTSYVLVGEEVRRCAENGTWSGSDPVCQPVSCGDVPAIVNGQVTSTTTTYLSLAQYLCDPGFVIQGSSEIICDASGVWVPGAPTCEPRVCPQPVDVEFGSYALSGLFVYNTTLEYTCNTGYQLIGESKMECQRDGTWSSLPPKCQQIECPLLDNPINVCEIGRYGEGCTEICSYKCVKVTCNTTNGACVDYCCQGYKPPLCIEECDFGFHGYNCTQQCSNNCNGTCNKQTGSCLNGCLPGYVGAQCDRALLLLFFMAMPLRCLLVPDKVKRREKPTRKYLDLARRSKIFGSTCAGPDCLISEFRLPEMHVGQWLFFRNMGAYSFSSASGFNWIEPYTCFSSLQQALLSTPTDSNDY